jgi:hypothetical protein
MEDDILYLKEIGMVDNSEGIFESFQSGACKNINIHTWKLDDGSYHRWVLRFKHAALMRDFKRELPIASLRNEFSPIVKQIIIDLLEFTDDLIGLITLIPR